MEAFLARELAAIPTGGGRLSGARPRDRMWPSSADYPPRRIRGSLPLCKVFSFFFFFFLRGETHMAGGGRELGDFVMDGGFV